MNKYYFFILIQIVQSKYRSSEWFGERGNTQNQDEWREFQFHNGDKGSNAIAKSFSFCFTKDDNKFMNMTMNLNGICSGKELTEDQYKQLGMSSSKYSAINPF